MTMLDKAALAWRRYRSGRRRFLDLLLALDDDPVLLCGCPDGRPCSDVTADSVAAVPWP